MGWLTPSLGPVPLSWTQFDWIIENSYTRADEPYSKKTLVVDQNAISVDASFNKKVLVWNFLKSFWT